MKRFLLLTLMVCFIALNLLGCSKGDNNVNMNKNNIPYSMRVNTSIAIRSSEIENKYGKANVTRNLKSKSYEVRNMDDGSKLFVIYDNATNRVIDIWQLKKLFDHESFKNIIEGKSTLKDIIAIDPYTTIMEKSKDSAISEHKLINNEVYTIDYIKKNGEWTVDKMNLIANDPSEFTKTILAEDLCF